MIRFRRDDPTSTGRTRHLPIVVLLLSALGMSSAGTTVAGSDGQAVGVVPDDLHPYSVAMHLHGLSNHNAKVHGDRVASMQWHGAQAHRTGAADVLWWSDHTGMFDQTEDFVIDLTKPGVVAHPDLRVTGLTKNPNLGAYAVRLAPHHEGGTAAVTAGADGVSSRLESDGSPEWQRLTLEPESGATHPLVHHVGFTRPISSDAQLELDLDCVAPGPDARCEIEVQLAWHDDEGRAVHHRILYRINSEIERPRRTVEDVDLVIVDVPARGGLPDEPYHLDLHADASHLPFGDDNTVHRLRFGVAARRSATAELQARSLRLTSREGDREHQLASVREFAQRYQEVYDLEQHVGFEYGDPRSHVNGFLPAVPDAEILPLLERAASSPISEWVDQVHAAGGLVSLNHPFLRFPLLCRDLTDELCVSEVARQLLESRALDADLLEVGYVDRGLELEAHLALWDTLTANGLLLYGTGVTDSHGGEWDLAKNSFTTWILARSANEEDLLTAAAAGRMAFGDPLRWNGTFALALGDVFMGDRVSVPGGSRTLTFELDPWDEDVEVVLVQGLLQSGEPLEYLHHRTPLPRKASGVPIETSRPTFVRLEAWQHAAKEEPVPVVFTNPIVLLPWEETTPDHPLAAEHSAQRPPRR